MRLREDFEPASGVKRRQLQCTGRVCGLLVPYSTLALRRSATFERPCSEAHGDQAHSIRCVSPTRRYSNARDTRRRPESDNAVLLRLQSVQRSRGNTQQ